MTVLFVPERIFRNSRQEGGLGAVEHLVGIELSSSSAVVATAVAQERQQAPHQLPAEVLQAVLDRIDPPHGWPRGSLRILAQTGAGLSTEAEGLECAGATASMRLCRRSNSAAAVYVLTIRIWVRRLSTDLQSQAGSIRLSCLIRQTRASTISLRSTPLGYALRRTTYTRRRHTTILAGRGSRIQQDYIVP